MIIRALSVQTYLSFLASFPLAPGLLLLPHKNPWVRAWYTGTTQRDLAGSSSFRFEIILEN